MYMNMCAYVYAYTYKNVPTKDIHSWILMPFTQQDSAACGKIERRPS